MKVFKVKTGTLALGRVRIIGTVPLLAGVIPVCGTVDVGVLKAK